MPNTIKGGPWDYLPVLNECIRILMTVAIGILSGYFKVFDADTFVPQAIKFIFSVSSHFLLATNAYDSLFPLGNHHGDRQRTFDFFGR
jgi:hypothetical protein